MNLNRWDDSKCNPCNWKWYWPLLSWMESECLCCSFTRAVALGLGIGLIASAIVPWWQVKCVAGLVLIVLVCALAMIDRKEPPQGPTKQGEQA